MRNTLRALKRSTSTIGILVIIPGALSWERREEPRSGKNTSKALSLEGNKHHQQEMLENHSELNS